jgi:(S)-sulfolactate dehydrogenase
MKKIVITEFMDESAVASLRANFHVVYDPGLVDDTNRLISELSNADGVIVRNRTQVRGNLLAACKQTTVIGRLGVGLDNIDVAECKAQGIQVIPATGANALAVAEYVIGTAMVLLRGVYLSSEQVASGLWPRASLSNGREISGTCLGLLGFGGIGQLTARLAQCLGMRVVAHDPLLPMDHSVWHQSGVQSVSMDQLMAQADVISLHVPLTPSTSNMLSAQRIAEMKPGAIVINTSRGGIVDEAAVAAALHQGHLGGAAFDVFEPEPLGSGSAWQGCPNVILTPHIAGVTAESNARVSSMIASAVAQALKA